MTMYTYGFPRRSSTLVGLGDTDPVIPGGTTSSVSAESLEQKAQTDTVLWAKLAAAAGDTKAATLLEQLRKGAISRASFDNQIESYKFSVQRRAQSESSLEPNQTLGESLAEKAARDPELYEQLAAAAASQSAEKQISVSGESLERRAQKDPVLWLRLAASAGDAQAATLLEQFRARKLTMSELQFAVDYMRKVRNDPNARAALEDHLSTQSAYPPDYAPSDDQIVDDAMDEGGNPVPAGSVPVDDPVGKAMNVTDQTPGGSTDNPFSDMYQDASQVGTDEAADEADVDKLEAWLACEEKHPRDSYETEDAWEAALDACVRGEASFLQRWGPLLGVGVGAVVLLAVLR